MFPVRVEMAIIAQRERKRFNQVRRLGIEVPISYVRIWSLKMYPQSLQKELFKFPATLMEDSEYESDEEVLKKYKDDPVKYI